MFKTTVETNIYPKTLNTYLGGKGYTIPKCELTEHQIFSIKKDLMVKPFVQGSVGGEQVTYPVYRESASKIYVPRFYGNENFGMPKEIRLHEGDDIDIKFVGKLRDIQVPVVEKYMKNIRDSESGGLLELYCGFGKTICALHICSLLKKKTLIIVHKSFLSNQWCEKINEFLPDARIGKIQGKIIDIEDKDIVICMLQSLSMKEYNESLFNSFGLIICDECHHLSSEVFSRALFKIVPKYTLGLSATLNRADGCSFVFKYFIGDVIHKSIRATDDYLVEVRKIEYKTNDDEFNSQILNFKGEVQYSSMISKLCVFNPRTEFIIKVLTDLLIESPSNQIIILGHNRNILKYIYDAISSRNICDVGEYLGGMKEKDLKESEDKQVIVSTFSMASEGLDLKKLSTLIMVTPKSEIEQICGRILREKNGRKLIIDIADNHTCFKNQYIKRQRFYKKNAYKIIRNDSVNYSNKFDNWQVVYNPNLCSTNIIEREDSDDEGLPNMGKCLLTYKKKI
jgi:superfamily II DNA or RNA helicase